MDKFLTKSTSNPNLSKRPREEINTEQWSIPKRVAVPGPQKDVTRTTTSNRFSGLQSDQDSSKMPEPLRNAIVPRKKTGNIPPILIHLRSDWTHGKINDIVTKFHKNFHLQYRGNNKVAVQCYSSESHRLIKDGLAHENVTFHTYARKDEKMYKAVIRGLPEYFEDTLAQELADIGFKGIKIAKLKSSKNNEAQCPPFLVQLPAGSDITKFRQIKYLGNCVIEIKRYKPNTSRGTQCYRCQGFGHSSHNCNLTPRCVKCTESHATKDCPKKDKQKPAKCCNCDQEHPANFRLCPARQKYIERIASRRSQGMKANTIDPKIHQAGVDGRLWSSVVNGARNSMPHQACTSRDQPTEDHHMPAHQDQTTKDMLEILNVIKSLKSKFVSCVSMVDKVILVLTHLSSYI